MGKSYRYDPFNDGDGFQSRKQLKKARKADKHRRNEITRQDTRMDGGDDVTEAPFDVMATIDLDDWSR